MAPAYYPLPNYFAPAQPVASGGFQGLGTAFDPQSLTNQASNYNNMMNSQLGMVGGVGGQIGSTGQGLIGMGQGLYGMGLSQYGPLSQAATTQAMIKPDWYADQAATDTAAQFKGAKGAMERNMSRMGINPASPRYQGLEKNWSLAQAAGISGAMTRARRLASDTEFGRLMQAANMADTAMGTGAGLVERGAGLLGDQARLGDTLARDYGSLAGGAMQARNQGLNLPPAQNSWIDGMFGNPVVSSAGLATASQQSGIPAWGARTPEEEDNYGEHPTDFGQ